MGSVEDAVVVEGQRCGAVQEEVETFKHNKSEFRILTAWRSRAKEPLNPPSHLLSLCKLGPGELWPQRSRSSAASWVLRPKLGTCLEDAYVKIERIGQVDVMAEVICDVPLHFLLRLSMACGSILGGVRNLSGPHPSLTALREHAGHRMVHRCSPAFPPADAVFPQHTCNLPALSSTVGRLVGTCPDATNGPTRHSLAHCPQGSNPFLLLPAQL